MTAATLTEELGLPEDEACYGFGPARRTATAPLTNRAHRRAAVRVRARARAACRAAPCCVQGLAEASRRWPGRRTASDGICGDPAHQARTSDHNPAGDGYAHAWDLTHDPGHGVDTYFLADWLRLRAMRGLERRLKYVISNRRIASPVDGWKWRPYTGPNPHTAHMHVSVTLGATHDTTPWFAALDGPVIPPVIIPAGPRVVGVAWHRSTPTDRLFIPTSLDATVRYGDLTDELLEAMTRPLLLSGPTAALPTIRFVSPGGSMLPRPDGYWEVDDHGHVYPFGAAAFCGSLHGLKLARPIVAIAPVSGGDGYLLAGADGGIFSFGTAPYFGSLGGIPLVKPIVGLALTPSDRGYWLVAADGGVFAFGDARFLGSLSQVKLDAPVRGIAPTSTGAGYWLVAADGGVFAFGDARFLGTPKGILPKLAVALVPTDTDAGYRIVTEGGHFYAYGDAIPLTNPPVADDRPVTAMAAIGDGALLALGDGALLGAQVAGTDLPFYGSAHGQLAA